MFLLIYNFFLYFFVTLPQQKRFMMVFLRIPAKTQDLFLEGFFFGLVVFMCVFVSNGEFWKHIQQTCIIFVVVLPPNMKKRIFFLTLFFFFVCCVFRNHWTNKINDVYMSQLWGKTKTTINKHKKEEHHTKKKKILGIWFSICVRWDFPAPRIFDDVSSTQSCWQKRHSS